MCRGGTVGGDHFSAIVRWRELGDLCALAVPIDSPTTVVRTEGAITTSAGPATPP